MPEVAPTTAIEELLLLHVPPAGELLKVMKDPWHTVADPVMAEGRAITVTVVKTVQPDPNEYVILVVPALTPETMPEEGAIVAMAVFPLVHIPPVIELVREVVCPIQTVAIPDIAEGAEFMDITTKETQPVGNV
jgi:hypothetical protein